MAQRAVNGIDINAEVERRGRAIMETDGTPKAVTEAMRGCPVSVFHSMDTSDNWYPVPEWHGDLRRARNNSKGFFKALAYGGSA